MAKKKIDGSITIKDIAAACGVSISTVSNVLNGKSNKVSKEVTSKILSVVEENKEIKEAVVEVIKLSEDEKMRKLEELREKAIMDEKDIFRAGEDKGKTTERIEIAKKILDMNLPIEQIIEVTSLTKEEIEAIK